MGEAKRKLALTGTASDAEQMFTEAFHCMNQGNYAFAENLLRRLWYYGLQQHRPNAAVSGLLGQCLMERARTGEKGFLPAAAEWLAASYHVNPDQMVGLQLGDAYAKMGSRCAAKEIFEALIQREDDGRNLPLLARTMLAGVEAQEGTGDLHAAMDTLANAETTNPQATVFRGFARMWLGRWREGWADHAKRFAVAGLQALWRGIPDVPYWQGEDCASLLLWMEQGHGDLIFASRWLSTLRARYPHLWITLKATPQGHDLLGAVLEAQGQQRLAEYTDAAPPADFQCSMMDLAHVLQVPEAPPVAVRAPVPDGPVCIKLTGLASNFNDADRSCHDALARVFLLSSVGPHHVDLDTAPLVEGWTWSDTVWRLTQARCLITVDTAVANIAAVLGVPTFLIPPTLPEYRWGNHDTDVSWAPNVRLVRRTKLDDWLPTLHKAAELALMT